MRIFKITDVLISSILVIVFFIEYIMYPSPEKLFSAYFITGGWQTISMVIHAMKRWCTRKGGARYIYNWITFTSIITMPIGSFWILFLTAPFMALFYTCLCYYEVLKK